MISPALIFFSAFLCHVAIAGRSEYFLPWRKMISLTNEFMLGINYDGSQVTVDAGGIAPNLLYSPILPFLKLVGRILSQI